MLFVFLHSYILITPLHRKLWFLPFPHSHSWVSLTSLSFLESPKFWKPIREIKHQHLPFRSNHSFHISKTALPFTVWAKAKHSLLPKSLHPTFSLRESMLSDQRWIEKLQTLESEASGCVWITEFYGSCEASFCLSPVWTEQWPIKFVERKGCIFFNTGPLLWVMTLWDWVWSL